MVCRPLQVNKTDCATSKHPDQQHTLGIFALAACACCNVFGGLLSDSVGGHLGVAAVDEWHDGAIGNTEALGAVDVEVLVDD